MLWGVFWIGDRLVTRWAPRLSAEVDDLYAVRGETSPRTMPFLLSVIGPAEELFWRGLVHSRAGIAVSLVAYALVQILGAQADPPPGSAHRGAFWASLFAWRGTLVAPVLSHLLWDLAIIVWFPARRKDAGPG